jgi:hypothetical protein
MSVVACLFQGGVLVPGRDRMRRREADTLDATDRHGGAQQIGEVPAVVAPRVHRLPEEDDLAGRAGGEPAHLVDDPATFQGCRAYGHLPLSDGFLRLRLWFT